MDCNRFKLKTTFSALLTIALAMLTGCSNFGPTSYQPSVPLHVLAWQNRQAQLIAQQNWNIAGSIGIRTASSGANASFDWQQQGRNYYIQLYGPMGIGHSELTGSPQRITLQTSDQKVYTARSPEALLQQQYGWKIPVTPMYYWVRGLPAPHSPATTAFDNSKHLRELSQQGWQITYSDYSPVNDIDLPHRITLDNPEVHIRMVIRNWQLNS